MSKIKCTATKSTQLSEQYVGDIGEIENIHHHAQGVIKGDSLDLNGWLKWITAAQQEQQKTASQMDRIQDTTSQRNPAQRDFDGLASLLLALSFFL